MKKRFFYLTMSIMVLGFAAEAQTRIGHIDMTSLIIAMPEYKKADSALAEYQTALTQQYADMLDEYNRRDSVISRGVGTRLTATQLEAEKNTQAQLYLKLQGWNQYAQQLYQTKETDLLTPIQRKAEGAVQAVAKENGYGYVLNRNTLAIAPPAEDDLLPLAKKRLGIR